MKAIISTLFLIILFIIAVAMGAQNEQLVTVNYLIAETELRLSWLMAGLFITGFLCCLAFLFAFYAKGRLESASLKRRLNKQQKQLNKLQSDLVKE